MESELAKLRSENWKLKSNFEKTYAAHRSAGLLKLKPYSQENRVESLNMLGSLLLMSPGLFEHFSELRKKFYKTKDRRLLTRMHETVEILNNVLDIVQKPWERNTKRFCWPLCIEKKRMCGWRWRVPCA